MKKLKTFFAAVVAACALAFAVGFCGCATDDDRGEQSGVIENGYSIVYAFTVKEDKKTADDGTMLDYMNALKTDGDLVFDGSDGQYGFFITSVMGISGKTVSSTANSYEGWCWSVYTTLATIDGVTYSDGAASLDFNGVTLYKALYGVSGLPCVTGASYALVYELTSTTW